MHIFALDYRVPDDEDEAPAGGSICSEILFDIVKIKLLCAADGSSAISKRQAFVRELRDCAGEERLKTLETLGIEVSTIS